MTVEIRCDLKAVFDEAVIGGDFATAGRRAAKLFPGDVRGTTSVWSRAVAARLRQRAGDLA